MDFKVPPTPVEGRPAVLAGRDLASHQQVAWHPVDPTAPSTAARLEALFSAHGPPLVIKTDHGSPFIAAATQEVLDQWKVMNLLSPARMPQYNGSVESEQRWMTVRTRHQAALRGRPEVWTGDDCDAARQQANTLARPWGPAGPTPAQAWADRRPITDEDRARFRARVPQEHQAVRRERGLALEAVVDRRHQATINRIAIRRALVALGFLTIRRRPVSLLLRARLCA